MSLGDFQTLLADDKNQIYVYRRCLEEQTLIVALNNTRRAQQIALDIPATGCLKDVLHDSAEYTVQEGKVALELQPLWGAILVV